LEEELAKKINEFKENEMKIAIAFRERKIAKNILASTFKSKGEIHIQKEKYKSQLETNT
jgi:hypothetical protein